jgi:hypothetical protein
MLTLPRTKGSDNISATHSYDDGSWTATTIRRTASCRVSATAALKGCVMVPTSPPLHEMLPARLERTDTSARDRTLTRVTESVHGGRQHFCTAGFSALDFRVQSLNRRGDAFLALSGPRPSRRIWELGRLRKPKAWKVPSQNSNDRIGSDHPVRQSFGERPQQVGSYRSRFGSACPLSHISR